MEHKDREKYGKPFLIRNVFKLKRTSQNIETEKYQRYLYIEVKNIITSTNGKIGVYYLYINLDIENSKVSIQKVNIFSENILKYNYFSLLRKIEIASFKQKINTFCIPIVLVTFFPFESVYYHKNDSFFINDFEKLINNLQYRNVDTNIKLDYFLCGIQCRVGRFNIKKKKNIPTFMKSLNRSNSDYNLKRMSYLLFSWLKPNISKQKLELKNSLSFFPYNNKHFSDLSESIDFSINVYNILYEKYIGDKKLRKCKIKDPPNDAFQRIQYHFLGSSQFHTPTFCSPCIFCNFYSIARDFSMYLSYNEPIFTNKSKILLAMLYHHLKTYHPKYLYEFSIEKNNQINIYMAKSEDRNEFESYFLANFFGVYSKKKRHYWTNIWNKIGFPPDRDTWASLNLLNNEYGKSDKDSEMSIPSMYYNSITQRKLREEELDDSSGLEDESKVLYQYNQLRSIDDFVDISKEEKELMKLWNSHIFNFPGYGDSFMPLSCDHFVRKFANILVQKNLRFNFLLHLFNLYDFGLISSDDIFYFISLVDEVYYQELQLK